jgi:hypothetical protein
VYVRRFDSSVLAISLSLHRHPFVCILFNSHFTCYNKSHSLAQLKTKVGRTLVKDVDLRINLNIDGSPITSRTHSHPSHSQTSRLLTSSLSLGVPVPRTSQCIRRFILSNERSNESYPLQRTLQRTSIIT